MTVAELVAKLGLKVDPSSFEKGHSALEKLKHAAEGAVEALAVHKIHKWMEEIVESTVDGAKQVKGLATSFGLTTDRIQEMMFATKPLGQGGLALAMRKMMVSAETGGKGASAAFAKLGVSVRDANGNLRPADELLEQVADGLQRAKNPAERLAAATTIFGRQGMVMSRVLKGGSEELRKQYGEARKLGIMTEHDIEVAEEAHEAEEGLEWSYRALYNTIGSKLMPAYKWLIEVKTEVVQWFIRLAQHTDIVRQGAVILSGIIGILAVKSFLALLAVIGPIGVAIIVLGAIIWLVVDEILTALAGGETIGRKFIDWVDGVVEAFNGWLKIHPVIDALLLPLKEVVFWAKMAGEAVMAAAMAATGDMSGFRLMKQEIAEHAASVSATLSAAGGAVANYVAPSGAATAAQNYQMNGASLGGVTVHQTINALPGQSEHAVGNAAADALKETLDSHIEQAHHKLVPRLATVPGAG